LSPVGLTKVIASGTTTYYLSFNVIGSTINYNINGVSVIFFDGTKWFRPNEKISLGYSDGGYQYSSFTRLTLSDLKLFQNKNIEKFELYIYDKELQYQEAEKFRFQANILETVK
jgi:hypothetical protein